MERFEPFAGRTRRRIENNTLVSVNELIEKIDVREIDPSKHLFVDEEGRKRKILSKISSSNDEMMLLLDGGASRLFTKGEDDVPVVSIAPRDS